jgi:2-polyprenyl-3-methyl-5-hydroxy-6-metoxy-1,4-benzoquinol methylase
MFNSEPKIIDSINVFNFTDLTAVKVKSFYKDDPFPNYELTDDKASIVFKGDNNLYTRNLKKFIGHGKKILEIGAGTCQLSNYLAIGNNNSITAFDLNYDSLKIGSKFAKKNEIKNITFVCGDIFDNIFKENIFDFILCNGVLHHTKDTNLSFEKSLKWLKKDGFVLVGLYNKIGRLRTKFRKYAFKLFGKKYLMFFDPVLRKINKDSKKKIDAWIKDQYQHPVERSHSFDEVLNLFQKNKINFINSYPSCEPFQINDNDKDEELKRLFIKGSSSNYYERIFSQILMIFGRPGSEGGLFLFLGKK